MMLSGKAKRSGRQALAALGAAGGDNSAAANSGHAGPKAVTALAHKLAGLIGAFHDKTPFPEPA